MEGDGPLCIFGTKHCAELFCRIPPEQKGVKYEIFLCEYDPYAYENEPTFVQSVWTCIQPGFQRFSELYLYQMPVGTELANSVKLLEAA